MKRNRVAVVVGLMGLVSLAANCKGDKGDPGPKGDKGDKGDMGTNADDSLRAYLAKNGPMNKWQLEILDAICQVEQNTRGGGLDPTKRVCPNGPPSITPPPSYPPR
jgi:hypothetical protein